MIEGAVIRQLPCFARSAVAPAIVRRARLGRHGGLGVPSPVGHALAGAAIAWVAQSIQRAPRDTRCETTLVIACASLAVAPDLDFVYPPVHRMMSHSVAAVVAVAATAALIARRTDPARASRVALVCALAYASHLLLDWLGRDTKLPAGLQILWPFSDAWYISPWGVFHSTYLDGFFRPRTLMSNATTVMRECLLLTPVAFMAWLVSRLRGSAPRDRATLSFTSSPHQERADHNVGDGP